MNISTDELNMIFEFHLRSVTEGLPDTFVFIKKIGLRAETEIQYFIQERIRADLFKYSDHDDDSISNIFNSLTSFQVTKRALIRIEKDKHIVASRSALAAISRNEEIVRSIRDFGIKFKYNVPEFENCARLFDDSMKNLVGILNIEDLTKYLLQVYSLKQLINLEEFFGQESFEKTFKHRYFLVNYDLNYFFKYRLLFRYMLKSSNRNLLLNLRENDRPYLKKLALELNSNDKKFLLD